jgi:hypothetical protein
MFDFEKANRDAMGYERTGRIPNLSTDKGTLGRVYGGNPDLIHVADGKRAEAGKRMAVILDSLMREHAEERTEQEKATQSLCPGCYMVVGFNMLTELARRNGQPLGELALSMAGAFLELASGGPDSMESIAVMLDPD